MKQIHLKTKLLIVVLAFLISVSSFSQQLFSDEVVFGMMPYTKGEVKQQVIFNNPFRLNYSEQAVVACKQSAQTIVSILSQWEKLQPPIGFEARFNTSVQVFPDDSFRDQKDDQASKTSAIIELLFAPYISENTIGKFANYEVASKVTIYINYLSGYVPGNAVVENIYVSPRRIADFHGVSIYQTARDEITIVAKKGVEPFLPVTREEFLQAEIRTQIKEQQKNPLPEKAEYIKNIDDAYKALLKVDKLEAEKLKEEALKNMEVMFTSEGVDLVKELKKEWLNMPESERKHQAYYSIYAMEKFRNASGLCPLNGFDEGEPLVKINHELLGMSGSGEIKLLVINKQHIQPTVSNKEYDNVHQWNMMQLYEQENLWRKTFDLVAH